MACNKKITDDILADCADAPKRGLDGEKAVIINFADIDRTASVQAGAIISTLALQSGLSGFGIEWLKEGLASANSSLSVQADNVDGFLQSFLARLSTTSAENAERANELKQGRFIVVVETRYKGASSAEAFKVYGWDNGLKLTELTNNTLENSGSTLFTVSTEEGDVEQYPYNIFLDTDYATSKAAFDALFAAA